MKPDFDRVFDLMHWGGRLFYNGAWWLLLCNAIALSGIAALVVSALGNAYRGLRRLTQNRDTSQAVVPDSIGS